jgi:ABC-2 type transport system ATP-binding protein
MAAAIEVRDLRKAFGSLQAVGGVSFTVDHGEAFGIVGPNGAGKTTTLEIIEGLRRPDSGEISILGEAVWPHPERVQRRIGVQLQTTALFDGLTAAELLALFARFYGPVPEGRVAETLAAVGLSEKGRSQIKELSGGQQQRIAIALALVHDPEIVFLDEPTTGLDPQARRNLWDVVESIKERGKTVILTTHYMEEAARLCNRVAIMDGGRIIALDTPVDLVRALGVGARITFRAPDAAADGFANLPGVDRIDRADGGFALTSREAESTVAALLGGTAVSDLAVERATLEDVFLSLTGREYRE